MDDVILDPGAGLPRLAPLRAALAAHDWPAARRVLDQAASSERTLLVYAAADPAYDGLLRDVLGRDPDDSAAAVLLAENMITSAWAIRGGASANRVSEGQFEQFHEGLRHAEWVLIEAGARRPDDPTVWALRLTTARGLGLDLSECRRRYDRLAALDPYDLPGQTQLLQSLCPKWGGTWEAAFDFVRAATKAAPDGSVTLVGVADVHIERWLDLRPDSREEAARYLASDDVRREIDAAAARSVFHPAFGQDAGWVRALSTFAFVYSEQGDDARAGRLFTRLGPLASTGPWDYLSSDPAAVIRERRARASAGAPR